MVKPKVGGSTGGGGGGGERGVSVFYKIVLLDNERWNLFHVLNSKYPALRS